MEINRLVAGIFESEMAMRSWPYFSCRGKAKNFETAQYPSNLQPEAISCKQKLAMLDHLQTTFPVVEATMGAYLPKVYSVPFYTSDAAAFMIPHSHHSPHMSPVLFLKIIMQWKKDPYAKGTHNFKI